MAGKGGPAQLDRLVAEAIRRHHLADEAIDTLHDLIENYELKGDAKSKDMYYWYARALEGSDEEIASSADVQLEALVSLLTEALTDRQR